MYQQRTKLLNDLFSFNNNQKEFDLEKVIRILNVNRIPLGLEIANNMVFIRDLANYILNNHLEPQFTK